MPRRKNTKKKSKPRSKPRSKSSSKLRKLGGNGENNDEIKNIDKIIKEVTDEEKLNSLIRLAKAQISKIKKQKEQMKTIIDNPNEIRNINPNTIIDRINEQ